MKDVTEDFERLVDLLRDAHVIAQRIERETEARSDDELLAVEIAAALKVSLVKLARAGRH